MSDNQQRRVLILERVNSGSMTIDQAGKLLKISSRQVRTLKKRYSAYGMAACIHSNRGRAPSNKTDAALVNKLQDLAGADGIYKDFNTCYLAEILAKDHDIVISRPTLDRILISSGLRKRKRPGDRTIRKLRRRRSAIRRASNL